jgi:hypothetical protein
MPIEIREIVIRATVNEQGGAGSGVSPGSAPAASTAAGGGDVIQECVEQVMQIIQDKEAR